MKAARGLDRAVWAGAITVALMALMYSSVQAAESGLPDMIIINLIQSTTDSFQSVVPPAISTPATPEIPSEPAPALDIVAQTVEGYVVFANNARHLDPRSTEWPQVKLQAMVEIYDEAILSHYAAEIGFGAIETWAEAFGISKRHPIVIIYVEGDVHGAPARAAWQGTVPVITHYTLRTAVRSQAKKLVVHELAHIWDHAHGWMLSEQMVSAIQNSEGYPTAKAQNGGPKEDFAESVTAVLWDGYAVNAEWTDDTGAQPDSMWTMDRHDYVSEWFRRG